MAEGTCAVDGCERPREKRGWCGTHYYRWRVKGDPGTAEIRQWPERRSECSIDGCDLPIRNGDFCNRHYLKWRRRGDPLWDRSQNKKPPLPCPIEGCDRLIRAGGYCNTHYERQRLSGDVRAGEPVKDLSLVTVCVVDGCEADISSHSGSLCRKHSARLYRTGTTDPRPKAPPYVASNGYLKTTLAGHPLTESGNQVYIHRVVLYEKIGPGTHPCHYCGDPVTWNVDLETDHVDSSRLNNDPSNLVPACRTCNTLKAQAPRYVGARLRLAERMTRHAAPVA